MSKSDATERLASLETLLQEDPGNASLCAAAALAALDAGLASRASVLLDSASQDSGDTQLLHVRGLVALAEHRFADAAAIFEALIQAGADAPALRFNLAYAQFRGGDLSAAEAGLRGLLAVEGAPPQTLVYLVRSLHGQGRPEAALDAWQAAPDAFRTTQTGGIVSLAALDAGRSDEARRLSEAALAGAEPPPEALVTCATLLVGDGNLARAELLLDRAMQVTPNDGRVWSAVGAATLLGGDVAKAEMAFTRACEVLPQHVGSWVTLAWCQILSRDFAGARYSLDAALVLDRNFAETHGAFAVMHALLGQAVYAEQAIERALRLDRKSLSARYAQAILAGEASDRDAVQALALRLLRGRPGPDGVVLLERVLATIRSAPERSDGLARPQD